MATTYGLDRAVDSNTLPSFDDPMHLSPKMDSVDRIPIATPTRGDGPPPNPPFSFPALPSPSSAPPSFSRASGRRPQSAIESPSPAFDLGNDDAGNGFARKTLPAFSFNPGAALPPDPMSPMLLSPPTSPNTPRMGASSQRPVGFGHRRGGSEFVGGRLRDGNSIAVMGTSPTKSESGFASPTFQPPRRSHRRGHSSAISSNDIPTLPPPEVDIAFLKGSSAPTSPTDFQRTEYISLPPQSNLPTPPEPEPFPIETEEPTPEPESQKVVVEPKAEATESKTVSRARVGFSDTLEFIPRPLSLVSSDTSSTMTARPGHSVTGSMSSLLSLGSPHEQSSVASPSPLSRSPTRDADESRPSTAGAILERTLEVAPSGLQQGAPRRRNSIPALSELTEVASATNPPTPSPTKVSKRWSFFGLDAFASSSSPTKTRPQSASSSESAGRAFSAGSSSEHGSESIGEGSESASSKTKKSRKHTKQKKTKKRASAWAGAILPRKSKSQSKRAKISDRPPTPPAAASLPVDDEDDDEDDTTPQAETPPMPTLLITESQPQSTGGTPEKRSPDEPSTPMIDLDAALGPFNTPLGHNPEWEAAQRAAGSAGKRRLHSAQGLKGFSGPGMHYHRRAESAPDLPPFEAGRSSIHRFGSNSTMADVFEEDEEDDGTGKAKQEAADSRTEVTEGSSGGDLTPSAVAHKTSAPELLETASMRVRRKSSGLSDRDQTSAHSIRAERSRNSLHDNVIIEDTPSIIFRSPNVFSARPDSANSAATSHRKCSGGKELSPVDIGPLHNTHANNAPLSPYTTSLTSSYPSPRSPMSVDAQRISTAPSSVNDENNFQSLLMGEPGPEVRISMDYDIPSLTSSTSTMTRDSAFTGPNPRIPKPMSRDNRPVSVGSTAFGRRRSSLVSLSRLISSSHGERSKLSMEVTLDNNDTDKKKKQKTGKSKKIGRFMNFWRPNKESENQS